MILLGLVVSDEGMTENDIIRESQNCGIKKFNMEDCLNTKNCIYMDWYVDRLLTSIPICLSYNEMMRYFVGIPEKYLEIQNIKNHTTITKENFCDIIDMNDNFLEVKGKILLCKTSLIE